ncbi:centrosomal protein of 162 kDa isoform X2 [Phascolarctos cinereus]|uniref:Centrosomal protein of 162 kDa n=1 Tax=Phascolarctos cinereus TaxID=38626 RepID=A0A6P5J3Q4_PHACI|nr:centrosomal protein of 162 kDa isoform X2 [Phascolarctos cinereus]XP_020825580.1 centrosomal protein of 162 kDa isoform X2 [Phascolarctos cinereus]
MSLSDDSFGNSKKTYRHHRKRDLKKTNSIPWWLTDDDIEDDGVLGTNVNFLKSQKISQPVVEMEEVTGKVYLCKSSGTSVISRDSLETNDSVVASGPNLGILGLDTLEEQEEKERFFAILEKGLTSTIDYSKLNKELDSNESTKLKDLLRNETKMESTEDENEDDSKHEEIAENYSDDFEDDGDVDVLSSPTEKEENQNKQNPKSLEEINAPAKKEEKTGMLANVMLLDSLDSVAEVELDSQDKRTTKLQAQPEVTDNEMTRTGMSYGQSSSDLEALHQAYHHIDQSLGDTDEPKIESSKSLVQDVLQETDECSKNISTPESALHTVEELMKPIRMDSLHGNCFSGQPVSMKKPIDSKTTEFVSPLPLKKQPPVMSHEQPQQQHLDQVFEKNEKNIFLQKTTNKISESSLPRVTPTEEHLDKMHLDLLRKKLSQDSSPLVHDSKINQAIRSQLPQLSSGEDAVSPVINKQATSKKTRSTPPLLKRKSQSGPYASVSSSGYGKSYSPLKAFSTVEKKTSKDIMKKENLKSKSPPYKIRQKGNLFATKLIRSGAAGKQVTKTESCLATPNKSLANDPQHQVPPEVDSQVLCQDDSILCPVGNQERELYWLKRVQEAEEKWSGAQAIIEQIKATFSEKEKELENKMEEIKKQQEKELFRVNQDNYILQAKLNSFEETNKKLKWFNTGETAGPISEEKLKQIQKEIQEQETLLQGYQQENERLYKQVKELQVQNKKNEERLFKENQCLLTELASLKEQLNKSSFPSQVVQDSEPNKNQSFTELLAELRTALKEKNRLLEEIKILKQDKQALEVDLEKMKKERDLAKDQIVYTSGEKSYEIKLMEETHKEEISHLQKRLQWYAENQELLDKDAVRLKEANEEIEKLKLQVEKLKTEAGNQSVQQKLHLKDRAADAKKIQDLERQVKEMEGIIKRRYPNSLPALILAASAAGDIGISPKNTVEFMEKRIKKLEAELEGKDEEAKKSLRTMEQQFQKIKIQYEQQVMELEQHLASKLTDDEKKHENSASMKALEQELCDMKEAHQVTVKTLEAEIEILKNQNTQLELKKNERDDKDFQSLEFQVEQAHTKARLVRLNQELAAKGREIQDLTKTIEKLQKERRLMLSNQNSVDKAGSEERSAKKVKKDFLASSKKNAESIPETLASKLYEPHAFADSHISEVLQENSRLQNELEQVTSEMNEQRAKSEAALAHSESTVKRTKEDAAEHIAALKASHQREVEKLLCQHAIENSSSKVAELNRKISTQEVLIKHLQTQVSELQGSKESLAISQVREEILQKEISKLLEELREAKESHTPEMKHFMGLERKIKHMEMRHVQREQELQQIIQQTRQVVETEQEKEVEKWKRLAQLKNQELEKFRVELDSILDVLRELHRQGVVVPVPFSDGLNVPEC